MSGACNSFSMEGVQAQLDELGWAVVPNVVPTETCDQYMSEINQWLQQFGAEFPNNINSIIHRYNIAHIASAWAVRVKAIPVFESLWGTNKLHTSMDGIAIGRPPELGQTSFAGETKGLHLDQGAAKVGLHAYQGAVYLEEALEDDWTFMVIEKSHTCHENFFETHNSNSGCEYQELTEDEVKWYKDHGCVAKRLSVPKGGMILWDSRTVHAGAPPILGRNNPRRWRYIVFVSMTPAIWSNAEEMEAKQECYKNMRVSSHWSSQGFSMFGHCKNHKYDISEMPDVGKSDVVRLLAGDKDYAFGDGESNGPHWKPKIII